MGYCSKKYLREKWNRIKFDMESVLDIQNEQIDSISPEDIKRTLPNIQEATESILEELKNGLK